MKTTKRITICILSLFLCTACSGGGSDTPVDVGNDTTGPVFQSGDPTGDVTGACSVTATFDEPIKAATVTPTSFIITNSVGVDMIATDGSWGLDPSSAAQIKFVPNVSLIGTYDVTLTAAITDSADNQLDPVPATWTFTSGGAVCPPQ